MQKDIQPFLEEFQTLLEELGCIATVCIGGEHLESIPRLGIVGVRITMPQRIEDAVALGLAMKPDDYLHIVVRGGGKLASPIKFNGQLIQDDPKTSVEIARDQILTSFRYIEAENAG